MNRRTFLKSAFVFILGLLGMKTPVSARNLNNPDNLPGQYRRIIDDLDRAIPRQLRYNKMLQPPIPPLPQIGLKPHHIWWTTIEGEILCCTFDYDDIPTWKKVSKVGDV